MQLIPKIQSSKPQQHRDILFSLLSHFLSFLVFYLLSSSPSLLRSMTASNAFMSDDARKFESLMDLHTVQGSKQALTKSQEHLNRNIANVKLWTHAFVHKPEDLILAIELRDKHQCIANLRSYGVCTFASVHSLTLALFLLRCSCDFVRASFDPWMVWRYVSDSNLQAPPDMKAFSAAIWRMREC